MDKKLCLMIDIEPDQDPKGMFGDPLTFRGIKEGLPILKKIVGNTPITFFVSGRCLNTEEFKSVAKLFEFEQYGVLFNLGDYNPTREHIEGKTYSKASFDVPFQILEKALRTCVQDFEKALEVVPTAIRFSGAAVNFDVLNRLGEIGMFSHSSSTAPGMLSNDKKIDHRLYKHEPYSIGKLVEVPFSVYGDSRNGWVSPVPGFALTDNVFEIMRKASHVTINMSLRDFVFGCSPMLEVKDDEEYVVDRLKAWLWFAKEQNFEFIRIKDVKPISGEF